MVCLLFYSKIISDSQNVLFTIFIYRPQFGISEVGKLHGSVDILAVLPLDLEYFVVIFNGKQKVS